MRPINSKERSTLVWQFILIFFLLAVVPVSLIFFSYFKVPEQMSADQQAKLVNYTEFERSQKILINQLGEIDSCINILRANPAGAEVISGKVGTDISKLTASEESPLIKMIAKGYFNYFASVKKLNEVSQKEQNASEKLREKQDELQNAKNENNSLRSASSAMPVVQ